MARTNQESANPAAATPIPLRTVRATATLEERNRLIRDAAASPASSAPSGYEETASPYSTLAKPRSALISG